MSGPLISITPVLETRLLSSDTALTVVKRPENFPQPRQGQFAKLKIVNFGPQDPPSIPFQSLLDRPFSFHKADEGSLSFLVRFKGGVTGMYRHLIPGALVKMTGPLGNPVPDIEKSSGPMVLLAGGAGLGPMGMFRNGGHAELILLYGEKTVNSLADPEHLLTIAPDVYTFTDDGSAGRKGSAADGLAGLLDSLREKRGPNAPKGVLTTVFCCGPEGLLKAAEAIVKGRKDARLYISTEAFMACCFGICLTCSQETLDGRRLRLCVDGPVFPGNVLKM
jgi:dihydroorotate dehydrogenase electron transfer subunit